MGKTEVPCRVSENIDPCVAPCFSSPVLLLFWDFGQASGHVGAQQPRDWDGTATCFFFFFPSAGIPLGGSTNTPLRGIDAAAKFTGVAPAGWPFRARVSEKGLAAQSLAMNTHARNTLLHSSSQQAFSCTILCFALPEAIHLLFDGGIPYRTLQPLTCS